MQVQRKVIEVHDTQVLLELPPSFLNHRVELIARTMDDEPALAPTARRPHPDLAGQGRTLGDIISPIVEAEDWTEEP